MQGEYVRLRYPQNSDHSYLVELRNGNLQHFFSDTAVSLESHLSWYSKVEHSFPTVEFFVIERDGDAIGTIGLCNISQAHHRAEYGRFVIDECERGKGYGRAALLLLLDHAFGGLGLNKVYGDILATNEVAIKLDESLGFRQEAIFRGHVCKRGVYLDVVRMSIWRPSGA